MAKLNLPANDPDGVSDDEVERQSFFLRRREELKEERRLDSFRRARARAGRLSPVKERQWAATGREGGRMTGGDVIERYSIAREVAA